MSGLQFFWMAQPDIVREFLRALLLLFLFLLVGIAKSAGQLFRLRAGSIEYEALALGNFDADILAKTALVNRLPTLGDSKRAPDDSGTNSAHTLDVVSKLRTTEKLFLYQWETVLANLYFARGMCSLILLISLMMIGFSAGTVFELHSGQYTIGWPWHVLLTFIGMCELLALGLSLCLPIYLITTVLEWRLRIRKARWQSFSATVLERVSVETEGRGMGQTDVGKRRKS